MSNQQSQPEENSKMDALVKVVLVFFISLLSFSVGTFVGKQVSDSDHRRASLEGEAHQERGVASTGGHGEEAHEPDAHSEEAVEDLASEFLHESEAPKVDDEGYSSYERKTAHHESDSHKENTPKKEIAEHKEETPHKKNEHKEEPLDAAKKISKGETPTSGKKVEKPRKPSSTLPAAASSSLGKYTVQVASYGSEDDAKKYASRLKTKGWNAFYIPAQIKGQTWFRVSVGLFEEASNAQVFMKQFLKESGAKDALVVKIVQ